jgi:alkylation response protein AidB-like acyl-CoA dehydrogenase
MDKKADTGPEIGEPGNPYSFDAYTDWRDGVDYYADDPFLQDVLRSFAGDGFADADQQARELSEKASGRWRLWSDEISWPENRPVLQNYDAHGHRIDRIIRPREIELMEQEIFSEALFSDQTSGWLRLTKMYLIYQNGEACISCPVTCTEGMVALLEKYADSPQLEAVLQHTKSGLDGDFAIGAQFLTEIQGGSDIQANLVTAREDTTGWRLYGKKFFCSAAHADYAVVTAKPEGGEDVAIFLVPAWLPGDKEREIRNGYTIDRLKRKSGTCELPTAEINFDGAVGYAVGPLDRGLANIIAVVLTHSRLTIGLSSAAMMTRAAREAAKYVEFRQAFGRKVADFPMVTAQVGKLEHFARRTVAGAFRLYRDFLNQEASKKAKFDVRQLAMLQKITASRDCTDMLRLAVSLFGGHGAVEDFSALPRLYRDSAINELWEGPRNVLLAQIHRELQQARNWYPPEEFVASLLAGADQEIIDALSAEVAEIVACPDLSEPSKEAGENCRRWDDLCERLFHAYQDEALRQIQTAS